MIAALDPGRDKCGFAVLEENGSILQQRVIETSCLEQEIDTALAKYTIDVLVLGNGTTSRSSGFLSSMNIVRRSLPKRLTGRQIRRVAGAGFCRFLCRFRRFRWMILSQLSWHEDIWQM